MSAAPGNAELVLASAVSVPMNIVNGLADLLIAKHLISRDEMLALLERLLDRAPEHGAQEPMVRMMLAGSISRFQRAPPAGSKH